MNVTIMYCKHVLLKLLKKKSKKAPSPTGVCVSSVISIITPSLAVFPLQQNCAGCCCARPEEQHMHLALDTHQGWCPYSEEIGGGAQRYLLSMHETPATGCSDPSSQRRRQKVTSKTLKKKKDWDCTSV